MNGAERSAHLAQRLVDDVITDAERCELQQLLQDHEEARLPYLRELRMHAALTIALGKGAVLPAAGMRPVSGSRRRIVRGRVSKQGWLAPLAIAASLALVVGGWWVVNGRQPAGMRLRVAEVRGKVEGGRWVVSGGPGSGVLSPASGVTESPGHQVAKAGEGMNAQRPSGEAGATRDTRHATLKIGDILRPGDGVEVGADGYAKLAYPDGTQIDLHGSTRLRVGIGEGENKDAKRLALDVGKIVCEAAKQPSGRPMRLATPHAVAEVVGTKYALNVDKDRTGLEVAEGSVRLTRRADNQTLLIGPGQNAEASDKGLRMLPPASADDWLKPLPSNEELAATTLEDGEIIFRDDFTNGLANWEVFRLNPATKQFEPLPEAMKDCIKIVSMKRGDQKIKAVRVDAGNEVVILALRQPLRERWFAVEFEDHFSDSAATGIWLMFGILGTSGSEKLVPFQNRKRTFSHEEQQTQWWRLRWEYCCGTDPQGRPSLDYLRQVGAVESRGRTRDFLENGIVRPYIGPGTFLISRVAIRRLVPKERAVGVP